MINEPIFRSFWMAGFECSDQLNHYGNRVDLLTHTGHIANIRADYELIKGIEIQTVREGIRWSRIERKPHEYDFSTVASMIDAARISNVQQLWDVCHFGYPDDLSPLHPHFTARFVSVCQAFARFYKSYCPGERLIVTPINEVGFISWLGGEQGSTTPYARNMGWQVKYALVRAYIEAIKAIKDICPDAQIMSTEPIVNIVPPLDATEEMIIQAAEEHDRQFQANDMLTGRICPELGGEKDLIDYMGYNFYYNNQWVTGGFSYLPWANLEPDPRWKGLSELLLEAYQRYGLPVVLAETSHPGEHRPNWIELITRECIKALKNDVPLKGICLYPIIDRPDWDHLHYWHHSGLWDAHAEDPFSRKCYQPYAEAIQTAMQSLKIHV